MYLNIAGYVFMVAAFSWALFELWLVWFRPAVDPEPEKTLTPEDHEFLHELEVKWK